MEMREILYNPYGKNSTLSDRIVHIIGFDMTRKEEGIRFNFYFDTFHQEIKMIYETPTFTDTDLFDNADIPPLVYNPSKLYYNRCRDIIQEIKPYYWTTNLIFFFADEKEIYNDVFIATFDKEKVTL